MCEASKGISDLFSNSGVPYESFNGYSSPSIHVQFDKDINAPALVRQKWASLAKNFFLKYVQMHDNLLGKLPRPAAKLS
eukprot:1935115-Karenia_brevis.AAC.1